MSRSIRFSLNRISAPRVSFVDYLAMCKRLGVDSIEIRNDLPGVEMQDGAAPATIKAAAAAAGITIRSINAPSALRRSPSLVFDHHSWARCSVAACGSAHASITRSKCGLPKSRFTRTTSAPAGTGSLAASTAGGVTPAEVSTDYIFDLSWRGDKRLSRWLSLHRDYQYIYTDSTDEGTYDEHRVTLGVEVTL